MNRSAAGSRQRGQMTATGTFEPRVVRSITATGLAAAAAVLLAARVVGVGEARGHAYLHLAFGTAAVALFGIVGSAWPARSPSPPGRTFLLVVLIAFGAGSLLEALGGAGYDAANEGHRVEALTTLHGVASAISGICFMLLLFAALEATGMNVAAKARRRREVRAQRSGASD